MKTKLKKGGGLFGVDNGNKGRKGRMMVISIN
jgi:hypothetical protein